MSGNIIVTLALVAGSYFLGLGKMVGIGSTPSKDFSGENYTQEDGSLYNNDLQFAYAKEY